MSARLRMRLLFNNYQLNLKDVYSPGAPYIHGSYDTQRILESAMSIRHFEVTVLYVRRLWSEILHVIATNYKLVWRYIISHSYANLLLTEKTNTHTSIYEVCCGFTSNIITNRLVRTLRENERLSTYLYSFLHSGRLARMKGSIIIIHTHHHDSHILLILNPMQVSGSLKEIQFPNQWRRSLHHGVITMRPHMDTTSYWLCLYLKFLAEGGFIYCLASGWGRILSLLFSL